MQLRMISISVLLAASAWACGAKAKGSESPAGGAGASLYDRLGGKDAITAVVDKFVGIVVLDDRINGFFKNADAANLKKQLVDQICSATGGPCKYTGKDMKTAHTGMKITEDDFNALVEDLVKALDEFKVPEKEKGELLGILGPLKSDIVQQ